MIQSRTFPTKDAHNERRKLKPGIAEYEAESSRLLITACGCALLIEIQTKFPAYPVRHVLAGCSLPGFDGYPLTPELSEIRGLTYIACAISSVQNKSPPWNLTGFQRVADTTKRTGAIMIYLTVNMVGNNPQKMLKGMATTDIVQSRLQSKRKYLEEMKNHKSNYPIDQIFASFLPEQVLLRKEDAANEAIVPEVAARMGNKGQTSLMKMWIRQAHQLAQETVSLVRGSPLIEATCCTVKLQEPESFWASQGELPELPPRHLQPNKQGSFLLTEFHPREAEAGVVEAEKDLYYRLFLKCCYDGPRKGHAHEPGLTNKCTWCGFEFPEHPSIMKAEEEGKPALANQDVNTDTGAFVDLLDTIHNVNEVTPVEPMIASTMEIAMLELAVVEPAPIDGWEDIMVKTIEGLKQLGNSMDKQEIAHALIELADASREQILIVKEKFKKNKEFDELFDVITSLSWVDFFNVIRVYFIVPFKRLLSNFDAKYWNVPIELVDELSKDHVEKYLNPILYNEIQSFVKRNFTMLEQNDAIQQGAVPLMSAYVEQMSVLLPFMNSIRPGMVPGGNMTLRYIQKCIFYGPLATMFTTSPESSSLLKGIPMQFILQLVADSIVKFNRERMSYDEKTIREKIAIRDEKERTNVIKEFDKLTPEERAVELTNKKIGLGKWAVGGSKLIYAYDKDYFDQERQKRLDAGIIDFPGHADGSMFDPEGRAVDDYGFPEYGGEEEGYSHNQDGYDDDE
jgi:hypothetical protein